MEINDKMKDYLLKQIDEQEKELEELFMFLATFVPDKRINQRISQALAYNRYIRHSLFDSSTCEHCKENGLID